LYVALIFGKSKTLLPRKVTKLRWGEAVYLYLLILASDRGGRSQQCPSLVQQPPGYKAAHSKTKLTSVSTITCMNNSE